MIGILNEITLRDAQSRDRARVILELCDLYELCVSCFARTQGSEAALRFFGLDRTANTDNSLFAREFLAFHRRVIIIMGARLDSEQRDTIHRSCNLPNVACNVTVALPSLSLLYFRYYYCYYYRAIAVTLLT